MKNNIFIIITLLSTLLLCTVSHADRLSTSSSSIHTDYYGKIDAIYPKELRLVINDFSINYTRKSLFLSSRGNALVDTSSSIRQGLYIKYHINPTTRSGFSLIDLQIISKKKFDEAKKTSRDN